MKTPATFAALAGLLATAPTLAQPAAGLLRHVPARHASAASRTAPIILTFAQPVTGAASLRVYSAQRGLLTGAGGGDGTTTLSWQPAQPLLPGEEVSVSIPAGVTGTGGGRTFSYRAATAPGSGFYALPALPAPVNDTLSQLRLVDLNRDGKLDALLVGGSRVHAALGNGQGGFGAWVTTALASSQRSLRLVDYNHDGYLDLLWTAYYKLSGVANHDRLNHSLGTGQGGFGLPAQAASDTGGRVSRMGSLQVGDFDGDGYPDCAYYYSQGMSTGSSSYALTDVRTRLGDGQGAFADPTHYSLYYGANPNPGGPIPISGSQTATGPVLLADLNNDDQLDWLQADSHAPGCVRYLGDGRGGFSASSWGVLAPTTALSGDLNADGQLDVLLPTSTGLTLYLAGAATPQTLAAPAAVQSDWQLADLDGDGSLDLLASCLATATAPAATYYWANTGTGTFAAPVALPTSAAQQLATGDLDGDGRLDVALLGTDASGAPMLRVLLRQAVALALHAAAAELTMQLYPNPAQQTTTVQLLPVPGATTATLRLTDALGRLVREQTAPLGPPHELPLGGLSSGVYCLQVRAGGQTATRRLVVE